jgi:hypothetical protein
MELAAAVVVFLLGASVGLLVALYLLAARAEQRVKAEAAIETERTEAREQERRDHIDATAAIVVETLRLVGAGLAAEIRETAVQQRNDLRLVVGLPVVEMSAGRRPRRAAPRATTLRSSADSAGSPRPTSSTPPAGTLVTAGPTRAGPGAWTVGDDEATPPSGWTLEVARARSQHGAERTP